MSDEQKHGWFSGFFHHIELSALITIIGIILLFSCAIVVTLLAPRYVDPTWTSPTSPYQVQMYESVDHSLYISKAQTGESTLQFVNYLKKGSLFLAFRESETVRIIAPPALQKYITRVGDAKLKLTSNLLLLRKPQKAETFDAVQATAELQKKLATEWEEKHPKPAEEEKEKTESVAQATPQKPEMPRYEIWELYEIPGSEMFVVGSSENILDSWVDANYTILDPERQYPFPTDQGVVYISNPHEYRITEYAYNDQKMWRYDPEGKPIEKFADLKNHPLGFLSRAELISLGEHIYAIEGCWYCHTDQTRTLVQDVVLNGSDSFPAPPSSASEYIYQKITFPGTRRIGPDLSRVAIKRPSRDWHKGHFWSPKTASPGSIMPAFRHFFDEDPRGTSKNTVGIPNYHFEAIYQYLMTKGTRITPPTQAWWLGQDPIHTKEIIEGEYIPPP